jgi:hypothetical protein
VAASAAVDGITGSIEKLVPSGYVKIAIENDHRK